MREYPRSWQEFQDILHWVVCVHRDCIQNEVRKKSRFQLQYSPAVFETAV